MHPISEEACGFGPDRRLVGILSRPARDFAGATGLILLSSGIIHRVGPNRLYVELARGIAAHRGCPVLRFDLAGIGDSGEPRSTVLADSVRDDIADSADFLCDRAGTSRIILAGLCSGADNAYLAALRDPRVRGVVLMDPSTFKTWQFHALRLWQKVTCAQSWRNLVTRRSVVWRGILAARDRLRGVRHPRPAGPSFYGLSRLSRDETRSGLEELVRRRVRLLYVFTGGLRRRYNYARQFQDAFRSVDFQGLLRVAYFRDADHTFSLARDRRKLLDLMVEWLAEEDASIGAALEERRHDRAGHPSPDSARFQALSQ